MNAQQRFYNAIDQAEAGVREMYVALNEAGVDLAESNLARRIRSIENSLSEVRDEVYDLGLPPSVAPS